MATRPVTITVRTEFYDVIKDYDSGNYLVVDETLSIGDTALLHINSSEVIGVYRGQHISRNNVDYAVLEPDTRLVALATMQSRGDNLVYFRVLEPRPRTDGNKVKVAFKELRTDGNKVKSTKIAKPSKVVQEEPTYYVFNYEITPIDTNINFDSAVAPVDPIKPVRVNKELLASYSDLFDQVQDASDIYEIIKSQPQCSTDITLGQAVRCNKLLRKAIC